LWACATFRQLLAFWTLLAFCDNGIGQFQAAFFVRSYGLGTGELGTWFALIYGIGGLIGFYFGGEWGSRFSANNERLQLRVSAVVYACIAACFTLMYLVRDRRLALVLLTTVCLLTALSAGPLFATLQSLVRPRMRATSVALVYLCSGLIGAGLGPLAAGALSDMLRPLFGEESLRHALLMMAPGYVWAGAHLWRGSYTVERDLAAVEEVDSESDVRPEVLGALNE
jgi:MFS family permease